MSHRHTYLSNLEDEIRKIIIAISDDESGSLICTADGGGMSSGVPGAFADALDRLDPTGFTNERFHILIAELLYIARHQSNPSLKRVQIQIQGSDIKFLYH